MDTFQKRDSSKWVGTVNVLTSDKKAVATAYAAEKADLTSDAQNHESTAYTYTINGDIASVTEKGVTTNYTYFYTAYPDDTTEPKAHSLTKTAQISNVGNITDANASGSSTQNFTTTETYDWLGRPVTVKDANQNVTAYEYDNANRVTKQTNPDETVVTIEYDDVNNTIITTAEDGAKQKLTYAPLGRNDGGYVYSAEAAAWLKIYENNYDSQSRPESKSVFYDNGIEKSSITYTYFSDGMPGSEIVLEGDTVLSKKEYTYSPYNGANESAVSVKVYSSSSVNLISRSTGGSKDYYYTNNHGDVTKLVNGSGTVVVDYIYDAFFIIILARIANRVIICACLRLNIAPRAVAVLADYAYYITVRIF